jgi:hypothetical protein
MASDVLNRMSMDVIASAISFPAQSECNVVRPDLGALTRKVTKRESFRKMRIGALTFWGSCCLRCFGGFRTVCAPNRFHALWDSKNRPTSGEQSLGAARHFGSEIKQKPTAFRIHA